MPKLTKKQRKNRAILNAGWRDLRISQEVKRIEAEKNVPLDPVRVPLSRYDRPARSYPMGISRAAMEIMNRKSDDIQ
jgi:hypothetical protein